MCSIFDDEYPECCMNCINSNSIIQYSENYVKCRLQKTSIFEVGIKNPTSEKCNNYINARKKL